MSEPAFNTDVVIGLEIHVGLATKSKLFCACPNKPSDEPNTFICPICLGHPGARPSLNAGALAYALRLAMALHCNIASRLVFSRKTYFYPDLVKNFQTTQYEEPLGAGGYVQIPSRQISLERMHMEEDPGALIHKDGFVLIDYNRSGTALCEIVTKPELYSAKEAREFVKKLMTILNYLDIFEPGFSTLKADLNISVKETNYTRVEIKGVSGLKDIESALEYEIARQKQHPNEVVQETRGYDAQNKLTFSQRVKEGEADYGYIYEPDLVVRTVSSDMLLEAERGMPRMVDERIKQYVQRGMGEVDAHAISATKQVADLFEKIIHKGVPYDFATKFFRRDIISRVNDGTLTLGDLQETHIEEQIESLALLLHKRKMNFLGAKQVFEALAKDKTLQVSLFAQQQGLIIEQSLDLTQLAKDAIARSEKAVDDYKAGSEKALNYLVGQVMKEAKGQIMPDQAKEEIMKLLKE